MSDRPDWLPESPAPVRRALPPWRRAVSLGLVSVAALTLMLILGVGGLIFSQANLRPGDASEKLSKFGFMSLFLISFAAILLGMAYRLRQSDS